jgi:diguanylate cyclase (GGDEF)-like protein/PAS domain S-box-containing protein
MTVVVIVDDQAINLKLLSRYARSLGKDVIVKAFSDAGEALGVVEAGNVDLIVSDYMMPVMNGAEFIRRCRQQLQASELPIIVVTAFEDREYRYRALEAGASDFLLSPVDGQEFCTRARNLLMLWRHQQLLKQRAYSLEGELAATLRQHSEEIRAREEHLRRVINTVPALIRSSGVDGRIILLNSYHEHLFDIDRNGAIGATKSELFGEEYAARHAQLDRQVMATREMVLGIEEVVRDRNRRERTLLTTKAPIRNTDGEVDQIVTVSLDITQRKEGEQAVRESEARFRSLVEGSVLGIVIERGGRPIFANQTYARIFGYASPAEILELPSVDALFAPAELRRVRRLRNAGSWGQPPTESREFQGLTRDGNVIWVEILTQQVQWQGLPAFQSTVADITLRKAYEERLQRQANFDEVTGLPNRMLAIDRLRRAVVSALRHHHKGGVLFIDLDHFKKINDTWGHAIGDALLRLAAERLRLCVREEDTVARLGGDEFTIILPNIGSGLHAEPVIQKILTAFSQPFDLGAHEAFVTASVGVTVFPDDSEDPAILMQNADAAMYRAKEQGRNTFQYFTPELNERAMRRMRIEGQLVHAVERNEFELHYQPIVDIRSGQLIGSEALLRWHNCELGALDPEMFVPLAEDTGLIVPVGRWVLDAACNTLAQWHRSGFPHLGLSVNISSRQLHGRGLVEAVVNALKRHDIPAGCLELEITEGCLMHDLNEIGAALQALDQLGVRLALDDFGTGYSCLSHLKELPVDTVKIDKSFVVNVSTDPGNATVVEAIIAMAHRLGIRVVGEGVESAEQLEFIHQRGCDLAQGYYFSRPLAADLFSDWCRHWCQDYRQAHA